MYHGFMGFVLCIDTYLFLHPKFCVAIRATRNILVQDSQLYRSDQHGATRMNRHHPSITFCLYVNYPSQGRLKDVG